MNPDNPETKVFHLMAPFSIFQAAKDFISLTHMRNISSPITNNYYYGKPDYDIIINV